MIYICFCKAFSLSKTIRDLSISILQEIINTCYCVLIPSTFARLSIGQLNHKINKDKYFKVWNNFDHIIPIIASYELWQTIKKYSNIHGWANKPSLWISTNIVYSMLTRRNKFFSKITHLISQNQFTNIFVKYQITNNGWCLSQENYKQAI